MRTLGSPPLAGTNQDLAVLLTLVAVKLVNRHGSRIATRYETTSSDCIPQLKPRRVRARGLQGVVGRVPSRGAETHDALSSSPVHLRQSHTGMIPNTPNRSEERRVGKECRS